MTFRKNSTLLTANWFWLVAALTVLYLVYYLKCEPIGDDWVYANAISGAEPRATGLAGFGHWVWGHYNWSNGRYGNYLLPFLVVMPALLRAVICTAVTILMYILAVKCAGSRRGWEPAALCAAICLALPWWDTFGMYAVQTNYIWPAVSLLLFWLMMFRDDWQRLTLWAALPLAFFAGCSHESGSLPMACGLFMYFVTVRRWPDRRSWCLVAAFALGMAVTLASPGLWLRADGLGAPDDTPLWLFLKSDAPVGVMWLVMALLLLVGQTRHRVLEAVKSPMSVLFWATFPAVVISIKCGFVGRPGFIGSLYALIVLAYIAHRLTRRPLRGLGWVLTVITLLQMGVTARWQWILGSEAREFSAKYEASDSPLVPVDCHYDDDAPWPTLGKCRGVPDADDDYFLYVMRDYYHPADSVFPIPVTPDTRIVDTLPADAVMRIAGDGYPATYVWEENGVEQVARGYAGKWYVSRRIKDPGDRI